MKFASWNVNSIKVRAPQVTEWLANQDVDVLGLQELKLASEFFPHEDFNTIGFEAWANGQPTYNGVALLIRESLIDLVDEDSLVTDIPGFSDPQRRVIALTINGVRVINVYVPNGQQVGSEKYDYKLGWLDALEAWLTEELKQHQKLVIMGDFNIAPDDLDVHDPAAWQDKILCSKKERAALSALNQLGLVDTFRAHHPQQQQFSWWDYRARGFERGIGLRIDLLLATPSLVANLQDANVDATPRGWERPSDHAPAWVQFTE